MGSSLTCKVTGGSSSFENLVDLGDDGDGDDRNGKQIFTAMSFTTNG